MKFPFLLSLGRHSKQASDERNLPHEAVLQKRTGEHDGREAPLPIQLRPPLQTGWR